MEEKKTIKVSLGTVICIVLIFLLILAIAGMYFYYNFVKNSKELLTNIQDNKSKEINTISVNSMENSNDAEKNAYKKYENLYWLFNGTDLTEIEYEDRKIVIQNGIAYLEANNSRKKIDSIKGNVKYIIGWGEPKLMRVYALTEDGSIYKSLCEEKSDKINDIFENVNIQGKVINMTNGNSSIRVTEPPYFLLSTGELINEQGSKYEELNGNFVKSFGNAYEQIYVGIDNTLSYYDSTIKSYIKIKDENGDFIKMKDAFIQWSSTKNNLVNENRWEGQIICYN